MLYNLEINYQIYIFGIIAKVLTKQCEKLCKILELIKIMNTNLDTKLYIIFVTS